MKTFNFRSTFVRTLALSMLATLLSPLALGKDNLVPVSIEYVVRLDHEKLGDATLGTTETTLTKTAAGYSVLTKTKAQGLAAIVIGSNEQQSCEFAVQDGKTVSLNYAGGRKDSNDYVLDFDWTSRKISFNSGDSLDMPPGYVIDSCNMPFAAALIHENGLNDEVLYVVDGRSKRIRGYKLKSSTTETIETSLGNKKTLKIVLEREFIPERTFTFWLAPEWGHVPLKMEEKRRSRTTTMTVSKIEG